MITWGLILAAMMFATGKALFYLLRALLSAAEAGVIFPDKLVAEAHAGQTLGLFYVGTPLAFIVPTTDYVHEHGTQGRPPDA